MEVHEDLQNVPDELELSHFDYLFHGNLQKARTPITTTFFSIQNLEYLRTQIAYFVGKELNRENIRIVFTNHFFAWLADIIDGTPNRPDISTVVLQLNKFVIDHEISSSLSWNYGLGLMRYEIKGSGGEVRLNNGTGTSTFYKAKRTVATTLALAQLGLGYEINDKLSLDFEFFLTGILSERLSYHSYLALNYSFGGM